ncbi:phosphoadenosine phosphosulfate reductase family protein [Desulfohalovibrio reitneri]|uniref:phosphoadenosine phosphosulfate reductase family protein n=1 Tax=Desulfohalovibrio reitneri TaxID=1307759 RepID=UPI00054E66CA|nr:phosphoadenosine phosphosulfate reductase family protein [Desulfohalovibrio reitneri]
MPVELAEQARLMGLSLEDKLSLARDSLAGALRRFGPDGVALAWTGGKDSTLALWLARRAAEVAGLTQPRALFIDDGDVFPEIRDFVRRLETDWSLELVVLRNAPLLDAASPGDALPPDRLDPASRAALAELDAPPSPFLFQPDSPPANHLLKTLPLRQHIRATGLGALITAVRWDEHPARACDAPEEPRDNPPHLRLQPLLPLTETEVWRATLDNGLPVCPLYEQGYRSLGSRSATKPVQPGVPAWEQDMAALPERFGRGLEKEDAMAQLRSLGYM